MNAQSPSMAESTEAHAITEPRAVAQLPPPFEGGGQGVGGPQAPQSAPRSAPRGKKKAPHRHGFSFVELLIALAICAMLLTATLVALDASFKAYQRTTEVASTHTIARLALNRMLTLIRTGVEFGPFPTDPRQKFVASDYIEFRTANNQVMVLEWVEADQTLEMAIVDPVSGNETTRQVLLGGVVAQTDPETGDRVKPFALEYENGRKLYRATIDLAIIPDASQHLTIEGNNSAEMIRLVASAMPRMVTY